jgi:hypothetical protein
MAKLVVQVDAQCHNYVFDVHPDPARRRELQFYGEFNCSTPGNCFVQPFAVAAREILRLCKLQLPVILNYTDDARRHNRRWIGHDFDHVPCL